MSDLPLVSVIISTHNRPDFLKKTLQSILQQSYSNLEVLVISNGFSNDNRKVVEAMHDSRLIYLEQENSGGPASPRNHGIRKSKGQYLAFCDDDDLWMTEKLEKQVEALEKNPEYGLCYTKMLQFDEEKEYSSVDYSKRATLENLLYVNRVPMSSIFIRKSLVELYGGFCESKKVGISEDYEFLLRHVITTQYYFLDEYLIKYWSGSNRTSPSKISFSSRLRYTYGILGCYHELWNIGKIPLRKLIFPTLYHLWMIIRVSLSLLKQLIISCLKAANRR
jgi:teichuronic acid biosynthesis glycosyltransferase TuaG